MRRPLLLLTIDVTLAAARAIALIVVVEVIATL
jgi:hypothetical protein